MREKDLLPFSRRGIRLREYVYGGQAVSTEQETNPQNPVNPVKKNEVID